jgi:CheY-like chemotaxis protein
VPQKIFVYFRKFNAKERETDVRECSKARRERESRMNALLCLIVDDEPAIRTYLSDLLQSRGIQSLEAENAVEALRILQRLGDEIDLLISDIQMPGEIIDGVDLAYSVKNLSFFVPVILISGDAEKAPNGFTCVQKPFRADAFLNAVAKAMTKTRAGSAR